MGSFRQDLAHAVRRLARRPAFALVATATLAVAIGGATVTFSVADAVILRPLPYAQPERLVSWSRATAYLDGHCQPCLSGDARQLLLPGRDNYFCRSRSP